MTTLLLTVIDHNSYVSFKALQGFKRIFPSIPSQFCFHGNESLVYQRKGNDHKHGKREDDDVIGISISGTFNSLWVQQGHLGSNSLKVF